MQLPGATGSRATTLAILALAGVTLDTRLRYGNDAADPHRQLSEPDYQSGALAHLEGEVGQLKGMLGAAQSTIGGMQEKITRLEAFFEPPVVPEPAQSPSGAVGADRRGQQHDGTSLRNADYKEGGGEAGANPLEARLGAVENALQAEKEAANKRLGALERRVDGLEASDDATANGEDEFPGSQRRPRRRRRRRAQKSQTSCTPSALTSRTDAAMAACCPAASSGGHRRYLQTNCAMPDTCPSLECADVFTPYFEECEDTLVQSMGAGELDGLRSFYADCEEMSSNAQLMLDSAQPAMIFHLLVVDEEANAEAQRLFDVAPGVQPLGPLHPISPPPPSVAPPPPDQANPGDGGEVVQEFRRICSKGNLTTCAPRCNVATYGYLLSIEIDGRGTVMTCNKYDNKFSWQGQASLGGFIGSDFAAFFSSVTSGAAGAYSVEIASDQRIGTGLTIRSGQNVLVIGHLQDQASLPRWQFYGVDPDNPETPSDWGLLVQDGASLSAKQVQLGDVRQGSRYQVRGIFRLHSSTLFGMITVFSGGSFQAESSTLLGELIVQGVDRGGAERWSSLARPTARLADCTLTPGTHLQILGGSISLLRSEGFVSELAISQNEAWANGNFCIDSTS
eukprot:COSAG04_NODE_2497_length_4008_cov_1.911486_1_plen_621_part_10